MKVAIWDTYITVPCGNVIHIDIIVPDEIKDQAVIFSYGKKYLNSISETGNVDADHCQYCHIETPTEQMLNDIDEHGFSILRMEDIPKILPRDPNRRAMILHLRGHYKKYRFSDFKGIPDNEIDQIIQSFSS